MTEPEGRESAQFVGARSWCVWARVTRLSVYSLSAARRARHCACALVPGVKCSPETCISRSEL
eukprot:scaffold5198_cov48-Phaeocystis_antarctica.AAC.1